MPFNNGASDLRQSGFDEQLSSSASVSWTLSCTNVLKLIISNVAHEQYVKAQHT